MSRKKRQSVKNPSLDRIMILKGQKMTVTLYLNTDRNHQGVKNKIPFGKLIAKSKKSEKELWNQFKNWCFGVTRAHTAIQRIYEFPSHKLIKDIYQVKDGGRYLVVGKEYALGKPEYSKRDYPVVLKKERKEFVESKKGTKSKRASISVPPGSLTLEDVNTGENNVNLVTQSLRASIPQESLNSIRNGKNRRSSLIHRNSPIRNKSNISPNRSPVKPKSLGFEEEEAKSNSNGQVTSSFLSVFTSKRRSKSPNPEEGRSRPRPRPVLRRGASISDMLKDNSKKTQLLPFLVSGSGKKFGIGYSPGSSQPANDFGNVLFVTVYMNTVRLDKGTKIKLDLHQIHRLGGNDNNSRFEYLLDYIKKECNCTLNVVKLLKFPSHARVKNFNGIDDGGRYLICGKETLLQKPSHLNRDYPLCLKDDRIQFLVENPDKFTDRISKPLLQPNYVPIQKDQPKILYIYIFVNGMKGQQEGYEFRFDMKKYSKCDGEEEDSSEGFERMKKKAFETMKKSKFILHTPFKRFFEYPSHVEVKKITDFENKKRYIVVGREYLLYKDTGFCPEHDKMDYPSVLIEERVRYLLESKMKENDKNIQNMDSPNLTIKKDDIEDLFDEMKTPKAISKSDIKEAEAIVKEFKNMDGEKEEEESDDEEDDLIVFT